MSKNNQQLSAHRINKLEHELSLLISAKPHYFSLSIANDSGFIINHRFRISLERTRVSSVPAFQRFRVAAFQCSSVSAFQRFRVPAFQRSIKKGKRNRFWWHEPRYPRYYGNTTRDELL